MQQLKLWQQREKEWARARAKREKSNKRNIFFNDSVMLLEAAARNDIDEGMFHTNFCNFTCNRHSISTQDNGLSTDE